MSFGDRVAAHALALVGCPFRLRGREPDTGLDCIGLAIVALRRAGLPLIAPAAYGLRNRTVEAHLAFMAQPGLQPANGAARPGDLLLVLAGPAQHHLVIAAPEGNYVHAHAGLGRVVVSPAPLLWPVVAHWRPRLPQPKV